MLISGLRLCRKEHKIVRKCLITEHLYTIFSCTLVQSVSLWVIVPYSSCAFSLLELPWRRLPAELASLSHGDHCVAIPAGTNSSIFISDLGLNVHSPEHPYPLPPAARHGFAEGALPGGPAHNRTGTFKPFSQLFVKDIIEKLSPGLFGRSQSFQV